MNVNVKNDYIKQFIEVFSREPFDENFECLYKNHHQNYYVNIILQFKNR